MNEFFREGNTNFVLALEHSKHFKFMTRQRLLKDIWDYDPNANNQNSMSFRI